MDIISEELVEETWREVSSFSPLRGNKEMQKLGKEQPELLAFMLEMTDELDLEVKELAIYVLLVVYRIFRQAYGKRITEVASKEILDRYDKNEQLVLNLEGAHEKFYERIARVQVSDQPYVLKYVVDTLVEMPDEDDPLDLDDDDMGILFLLLKTVVDLLNATTDR